MNFSNFRPIYWIDYSPEAYSTADMNINTGVRLDVGLEVLESNRAPKKNGGFFEKGLLQAMESDHLAGGNAHEVKVVANGHAHSE